MSICLKKISGERNVAPRVRQQEQHFMTYYLPGKKAYVDAVQSDVQGPGHVISLLHGRH